MDSAGGGPAADSDPMQQGYKLMAAMETLCQLADGITGYRQQLIDNGFSVAAAEQMATQLHQAVVSQVTTGRPRGAQ